MVRQYTEEYYMPSHQRFAHLTEPDLNRGQIFASWLNTVRQNWRAVAVQRVEIEPEHFARRR